MKKNLFLCLLCFPFLFFYSKNKVELQNESNQFTIPANVVVSNISFSSAHISWDAIQGSTQFTVKIRPQGTVTWMLFPVSNINSYDAFSLSPCTIYEVQVMENLTGDTSGSVFFTAKPVYCPSSSLNSGGGWLVTVHVEPTQGGFPGMISYSSISNYSDYTNDPLRKITLLAGSMYNFFYYEKGYLNSTHNYLKVWIDFNGNGIFEPQENVMAENSHLCCGTMLFSVPNSVSSDIQCPVVLRVINSDSPINDPCGQFASGEVEDYAVYFSKAALGTDENTKRSEIAVFPNPVSDILNISGITSDSDFEIYNAAGQKVSKGKTKNKTVNVNHLLKGVYFIQIKEKETPVKLKFIKK